MENSNNSSPEGKEDKHWIEKGVDSVKALTQPTPASETPEEILKKHAKNYKKTIDQDEKSLYHLQLNGYEAVAAMTEFASQQLEGKERELKTWKGMYKSATEQYLQLQSQLLQKETEVKELKENLRAITVLYENQKAENENRLRTQIT